MASQQTSVSTPVSWLVAADDTRKLFLPASGAANNLSPPDTYNHASTLWDSELSTTSGQTTVQRVVFPIPSDLASAVMLKFVADPKSDMVDEDAEIRLGIGAIWGAIAFVDARIEPASTEYVAEYLGQFDVTSSVTSITSSTLLPTGGPAFARRTTVRVDRACFPGLRVMGERGEASPVLVAGAMGYTHVIVELRCVLPRNTDGPLYPPVSAGGPISDVAVEGVGFLYRFA